MDESHPLENRATRRRLAYVSRAVQCEISVLGSIQRILLLSTLRGPSALGHSMVETTMVGVVGLMGLNDCCSSPNRIMGRG